MLSQRLHDHSERRKCFPLPINTNTTGRDGGGKKKGKTSKRGETQKQENEDTGNTYRGAENQQEKTQKNSRRTGGRTKKNKKTEEEQEDDTGAYKGTEAELWPVIHHASIC